MARVELLDDRFVIHNERMRRLLTIVGTITVRYEAVESVGVGLGGVPPWFTRRIGFNPGLGSRRAGIFWWRGKKWFLDVSDPARTIVVHLKQGAGYDAIAVTVDDAETLAAELTHSMRGRGPCPGLASWGLTPKPRPKRTIVETGVSHPCVPLCGQFSLPRSRMRELLGKPAVAIRGRLAARNRCVRYAPVHRVLLDARSVALRDFVGGEAERARLG